MHQAQAILHYSLLIFSVYYPIINAHKIPDFLDPDWILAPTASHEKILSH